MQAAARLFNRIARSHMYWGRKPLVGLLQVFDDVADGVVLDPFCGAGTPSIAALIQGGRVIAADLNPMGPFLTRVLARPLSIPLLRATFDEVRSILEASASTAYAIPCPQCGKAAVADFVVWNGGPEDGRPVAAKVHCNSCGKLKVLPLDAREQAHQTRLARRRPTRPYPETPIHTVSRASPVATHDRLFTSRNLALLADLNAAINRVDSVPYKEAMQYVFTASLYSCSRMQMYSQKDPTSSRGWTALRFYIPPNRKETNVLHAFSRRFEGFLSCKALLNDAIPTARVTDRTRAFTTGSAELLVRQMGWRDCVKRFGESASHVFLDPPYNEDVDYFSFSEFWGTWLGMEFPFQEEWHARKAKGTKTEGLLTHVAKSTSRNCRIVLALDPKDPKGWETEAAIEASGYRIVTRGSFLYDNSYKRGRDLLRRRDRYYVLERASVRRSAARKKAPPSVKQPSTGAVYPYVRAWAHFLRKERPSAETLRARTMSDIVPLHMRHLCEQLTRQQIDDERVDAERNRRTYQALCLALVATILKRDGWTLRQIQKSEVESGGFGLPRPEAGRPPAQSAVAAFGSKDGERKLLVFFPEQGSTVLSEAAEKVADRDGQTFKRVAVLVADSRMAMQQRRSVAAADHWKRGFFLCLDELRKRCAEVSPNSYGRICSPLIESPMARTLRKGAGHGIGTFRATVLGNVPVGGEDSPYRKLQFEAPRLTGIVPGQFIMMDTWPRAPLNGTYAVAWQEFKTAFQEAPHTYLKRPFGVHRAFHPGFADEYLKHLRLPRSLSTIMHTALPHRFDIFYKVLPNGKGTNEMKQLEEGMTVEMLGPLGRRFDIREMVNEGVEEVHVIGGGVGMAPLIFLVQALRYFSVPVKAFIGIESISRLRYWQKARPHPAQVDHIDETYAAGGKDVDIYVDDLKQAGVEYRSIFVSYDKAGDVRGIVPAGNHAKGLVSDLYARYLSKHGTNKAVVAFACGPMPMMEAIYNLTKKTHVDLHVLMEKRMACGIGVCLSCVCRTKTEHSGYSRVCKDGPIFNANNIDWKVK